MRFYACLSLNIEKSIAPTDVTATVKLGKRRYCFFCFIAAAASTLIEGQGHGAHNGGAEAAAAAALREVEERGIGRCKRWAGGGAV